MFMKIHSCWNLLSIAVGCAFTLLTFFSTSFACDCIGPSGKKAIRKDSVAFLGTVQSIRYVDTKPNRSEPRIIVTFSVSRVWSGDVTETFVLHTTENHWSCAGYYFVKDKEYLVVAYPNDKETEIRFGGVKNTFGTNPCGATLPSDLAKEHLAELGDGKKPKKQR